MFGPSGHQKGDHRHRAYSGRFDMRHYGFLSTQHRLPCHIPLLTSSCRRNSSSPISQMLRSEAVCKAKLRSRYRKILARLSMEEQWSCHFESTSARKAFWSGGWFVRASISLRTCPRHSPLNLKFGRLRTSRRWESTHLIIHVTHPGAHGFDHEGKH